jgi:hypothetical protein
MYDLVHELASSSDQKTDLHPAIESTCLSTSASSCVIAQSLPQLNKANASLNDIHAKDLAYSDPVFHRSSVR